MNSSTKKRRDAGVELARLLACLIVIGCHTLPGITEEAPDPFFHTFLKCIFGDGVAVFWMITGCFLFSSRYGKVLKHAVVRVLIPLILISIAGTWINQSGWFGFQPDNPQTVLEQLCQWHNGISGLDHLWYLYVYLGVMLLFPILKWIASLLDRSSWISLLFCTGVLMLFAWNDASKNLALNFNHYFTGAFIPASAQMLIGHVLYHHRHLLLQKKEKRVWTALACFAGFFLINFYRADLQMSFAAADSSDIHTLYWYTAWGTLAAGLLLCGCIALLSQTDPKEESTRTLRIDTEDFICAAASYSFIVYLVHYTVVRIENSLGVPGAVQQQLAVIQPYPLYLTACSLCMIAAVYLVSLLVSAAVSGFWKLVKHLAYKMQSGFKKKNQKV